MVDPQDNNVYSSHMKQESVRILMTITDLNNLEVAVGEAFKRDGYIDTDSAVAMVKKAQYGLPYSGHQWWAMLANSLWGMGFARSRGTHTDNLIVVTKDTQAVFKELQDNYKFKSTEMPEYYLGVVYVGVLDKQMKRRFLLGSTTYVNEALKRAYWMVLVTTSSPRKEHLEDLKRVYMYLNRFPDRKVPVDSQPLEEIGEPVALEEANFQEYYFDAKEDIDPQCPKPLGKAVSTSMFTFVGSTPVLWSSKCQGAIETSTYGAEFVAG
eukprot:15336056-Ditylum_brightwellii.AAC.1